jgi:7,8-dihydropterin-6-yl-methyl-4-(beta-D-ribofuranosyl)aminobenzene 5'-phosphate synthase
VTLVITYDNEAYDGRLMPAWGFSCLVRLGHKDILFDTGGDGAILMHNVGLLGIDLAQVDTVVLSHMHGDHVGGLASVVQYNPAVTIYMPASASEQFRREVRLAGPAVEEVGDPRQIGEHAFTTGELDGGLKEQALVLKTLSGLVVITGCAHPGVVAMVRKAKQIAGGEVRLVVGGFHLGGAGTGAIQAAIDDLLGLGVEMVAPCHCTGDKARRLFQERFGENYIDVGAGREIDI